MSLRPPDPTPVVLDRSMLLRSVQSNAVLLRRVVDLFDHERGNSMEQLRVAVDAGDDPTVRRVAHRFKGALLSIGAFAAAGAAGRAIDLAGAAHPEELRSALGQLAAALDGVAGELATLLAEHGA